MGPLENIRVLEMGGIGPGPFCGMLFADMGADVLRVDRVVESDLGIPTPPEFDLFNRGKRSVAVDLKSPDGVRTVMELIAKADMLIEGFRPGVMEKLGLGPSACLAVNPALAYGRMTGWGQAGPMSQVAGHDLNYVALTGALHAIGPRDGAPSVPLNLIGDLGGGALYLAMGLLAAHVSAKRTGVGQVVDAAMVDGVNSLMTMYFAFRQLDMWRNERESNILDGGAHFYAPYETKDGKYITVAPVEGRFYQNLVMRMGLDPASLPKQNDQSTWPAMRARFAEIFKTRTRDEWVAAMAGSDSCFAPVLDLDEVLMHPLAVERQMFGTVDGVTQPTPAPRFSATPSALTHSAPLPGQQSRAALIDWGVGAAAVDDLIAKGAVKTLDV